MRNLLLFTLVSGFCGLSLLRPRLGLLAYISFALIRPDYFAWALDKSYSLALGVSLVIGSILHILMYPQKLQRVFNPIAGTLLVLQCWILLSVFLALNVTAAFEPWSLYIRSIVVSLLIPVLVDDLQDLRNLILVMFGSLGLIGLKFGLWGVLLGGASFKTGHVGFLSDNNTLALGLVMIVPLCWCALQVSTWLPSKPLLMGLGLFSAAAIIMAHSRGAALALMCVLLLMIYHARRRLAAVLLIGVLLAPGLLLVSESFLQRMETIAEYQRDQSADNRLRYMRIAISMWKDHPVVGVGFGMQNQQMLMHHYDDRELTRTSQVIHNTYLQMLCDSGILAFLTYCGLLFGAWIWLHRSVRRMRTLHVNLVAYPAALQASLTGFIVGSIFLSRVNFDLFYFVLMAAGAWWRLEKEMLDAHQSASASHGAVGSVGFGVQVIGTRPAQANVRSSYRPSRSPGFMG